MKKTKTPTDKQLFKPVTLPTGENVPSLGMGTWYMGENRDKFETELEALKLGIKLEMSLIDTAEMYGDGNAEVLVGEAIKTQRGNVFLVDKFMPQHATYAGIMHACLNSLRRLKTSYLDLYLYHWRGGVPLKETVEALNDLVEQKVIRYWGVSNFDVDDMEELYDTPGGNKVAVNQVLYNLAHRGIELDLMPWCRAHQIPIMAYSPLDHGSIGHPTLERIAQRHGATSFQIALAWVLEHPQVIAIPKAGNPEHVMANRAALEINLSTRDMLELQEAFQLPDHPIPLEIY